jgi:hypothetical protein
MKFTSYYSKVVKAQGVPHLSVKQHQLLMNILFLEAGMYQLEQLRCEGQSLANKNEVLFKMKYRLQDLLQHQSPEHILEHMVGLSNGFG